MFYDEQLIPAGLRATQFVILQCLGFKRGSRIRELESLLTMDQTMLTRNLSLRARRRLIEVIDRPAGREISWGVTPLGKQVLAVANPLWERAQAEVRSRFGPRNTASLPNNVSKLAALFS